MFKPHQIITFGSALFISTLLSHAQIGKPIKEGQVASYVESLYVYHGDADIDSGGDVGLQTYGIKAGSKIGLANGHSLGFNLSAGLTDYSFSSPTKFGAQAPWDEVQRYSLGLQYNHRLDQTQSLFLMPSVEFAGENGATLGDALIYGGIAGYTKQFSRTLSLGVGGAVYSGLEDTSAFPVIFVYWQFAEAWRVSNPLRPGPSGPAGMEVVYTGFEQWEVSAGGSYRSNRFALDDSGSAEGGFGENEGAVLFMRSTYEFAQHSKLDFYVGTMVGGELTLEDSDADRIASDDFDPSLILAAAYTFSF